VRRTEDVMGISLTVDVRDPAPMAAALDVVFVELRQIGQSLGAT